jgi:hypothetical protein
MNQSFQRQRLIRLCKKAEYIDYGMTIEELTNSLDSSYEEIINDTFEFSLKQVNEYYLTRDLPNKLILRKLNDNIKQIYKDEQANRRIIISQVKTLLSETCPFWVIKTDITSFYESIDRQRLIAKFQDDSMLSYQSMYLMKKVFKNPVLLGKTGVPRGMNISATMSELYMRKFDRWIRSYDSIYYFARFVDDIIIFSNSLPDSLKLISNLNSKLSELARGLTINLSKTELFNGETLENLDTDNGKKLSKKHKLNYLGYSFEVENGRSKNRKLIVSIAQKKVTKIKTRVVKSFIDFSKNKNFRLLENRIQFLTGNYSIRKTVEGSSLRAGIYYNYLQVTDTIVFDELNKILRKSIFSKTPNFGGKIGLNSLQKCRLSKYCFLAGFKKRAYFEFTYSQMQEIINCW